MQRFEMIGEGTHYLLGGRPLRKGETTDSESDLVAIWPGKFRLVGEVSRPPRTQVAAPAGVPAPKAADSGESAPRHGAFADEEADEAPAPEGDDVTAQFPTVAAEGLKVYRVKGNRFNVIDPARPEKPLNDKPVVKAQVTKVVS